MSEKNSSVVSKAIHARLKKLKNTIKYYKTKRSKPYFTNGSKQYVNSPAWYTYWTEVIEFYRKQIKECERVLKVLDSTGELKSFEYPIRPEHKEPYKG